MRIPNKFNGYSADNRRLYNMGGGGTTYSNTSNIPPYAREYVQRMLGATEKEIYTGTTDEKGKFTPTGFRPYKPFQGETVAGFSPMQAQAMQGIQNFQLPGQTGDASNLAGYAGLGSMMAGQNYASQATNPYATQAYMSPYIQGALAPQMEEARRQANITRQQTAGEAVKAGAFGGSRFGIREAEENRNLGKLQDQIYGTGMQNAFQAAQQAQQFGANLGLQGYGQALQGANTLGQLGQQQYGQQMGLLGQQAAVGKMQQDYEQARLNQIIQDYATQQQYPFIQLGTLSNMLRGLPMQASTTQMYQAQPSLVSQAAGAVGTGLGLVQQYNQAFPTKNSKEGGVVSMASGGIATGVPAGKLASVLKGPQFDDKALQQKVGDPDTDQATKDLIAAEQARRAGLRAGAPVMAANGGIIAFKKGSKKSVKAKDNYEQAQDITLPEADVGGAGILKAITREAPEEGNYEQAQDITLPEADVGGEGIRAALKKAPTSAVPVGPEPEALPPRDYTDAIRQSYAGAQPKEEGRATDAEMAAMEEANQRVIAQSKINEMGRGVVAEARKNVSPVREAPAPVALAPAVDAQGITVAPQGPSYRDREAANLEAGLSAAGIKPETKVNPLAELEATTNEEMLRQKALRDESKGDKIKRYQKEREESNLADPANRERELLEARKTRGEKAEQETARNNLIRFLTRWGTIPGSALRGLVGAGAELVEKMDLDSKHKDKFLNELDDIESKINSAEYARRLGDEGRAREEQQKAGELYFKLGHDMRTAKVNYAIKEMDAESKYEIARLKADVAANKQQNKAAVIQMADKLFEGYIENGKPANPVTYNEALKAAAKLLPGVQAAEIGYGPKAVSAGADESRALTAQKDAESRAKEEARKRMKDAKEAADDETSSKTFRTQLKDIYAKEGAKTPAEKAAIRQREEKRVLDDKKIEYDVAPTKPAASAAAPAKAAAPKANEKKPKAEAAPAATAPAAPAAAPKLVWDPATGKWK
jgi:hypothetical protein